MLTVPGSPADAEPCVGRRYIANNDEYEHDSCLALGRKRKEFESPGLAAAGGKRHVEGLSILCWHWQRSRAPLCQ